MGEKTEYKKYSLEQRAQGLKALEAALVEAKIEAESTVEEGSNELYDSARLQINDGDHVPAAVVGINAKGFVNLSVIYTEGDQRATAKALKILSDVVGYEVKAGKYTKTKARPGSVSFLERQGV